MNLNDIPKEFFANFTSVLDNVCGKGTWFIAGGFVRDHMLEKPQSDMDVFVGPVKGLTMSLLLAVLNSPNQPMTKHGHWFTKFEVDYLYDDEEHSKHIQFILDHSNYKIQVIVLDHYIDGSTNAIDKYVRNNFDCTLSMCWWSPNTGIAAVLKNKDSDLSFIEDAHNKRLRFKKSTTQAYMSKIIYKYKDYKIGVTPYE